MSKGLRNRFLLIFGVMAACVAFVWPIEKRINLGLDLRGGMHLILKVDTSKLTSAKSKEDAVLRAMEILRNRIDSLGVGETVVQREGEDQILVQLPGVTDHDKAVDMVKRVAHLEFRLVKEDNAILRDAIAGKTVEGYELKYEKEDKTPILVESKASMQGDSISDAKVDFDSSSFYPKISLSFNSKGTKDFADLTSQHVGERLAIIMDNEVLSAPNVREAIMTGTAEISGQFSNDEALLLALALRSGSLPVPMSIEEERTIGPLLGKDSIEAGIRATIYGSLFVLAFMIMYYWIGGIIASIALAINLLMILGIMGFINVMMPGSQVTLTLPGIAGIVLTLGMAVDANVLINERIREELELGRTLNAAVDNGYSRALNAIIDSHVTSLIAAFLLFQFGSGPIKGFAVTLSTGLIASLFTSVYASRSMFMYLLENKMITGLKMMKLIGKTNFNFIKNMYLFCILSAIITVLGFGVILAKKDQAYGVDFAGGQVQEYRFTKAVSAEKIREVLKQENIKDAVIQQFDKNPGDVIIRTPEETYEKVVSVFKKEFKDNKFETLRIEKVGPVVGKALRERALWAILLALGSILIYLGIRFKNFGFAAAGVIALLHDIAIALGISVMMGRQIDLLVVTALLTIAGYSVNDTIVVFDRVRENLLKDKKSSLADIINHSINQTLGRTILTTFVTLLVVIALFLFGGEVLNTFSLILIIGFIAGVYSTMFIVTPIVLMSQKKWQS